MPERDCGTMPQLLLPISYIFTKSETKGARYLTYSLLAGQHLLTLVTRIALPYIVAFISQEQQLSEGVTVKAVSFSESAKAKIEAAGGKAEVIPGRVKWTREAAAANAATA